VARTEAVKATMAVLQADGGPEAAILRQEYETALRQVEAGANPRASTENALRRRAVEASRRAILKLRKDGTIGEDAYRRLEEEFDWLELSAREA
jgi:CPA1 family monovalent cation:H+ antiporter